MEWHDELTKEERVVWVAGLLNRERACGKKIAYSLDSARRAAVRMNAKTGRDFDVYLCLWCEKFHIGGSVRPIRESANGPRSVRDAEMYLKANEESEVLPQVREEP